MCSLRTTSNNYDMAHFSVTKIQLQCKIVCYYITIIAFIKQHICHIHNK